VLQSGRAPFGVIEAPRSRRRRGPVETFAGKRQAQVPRTDAGVLLCEVAGMPVWQVVLRRLVAGCAGSRSGSPELVWLALLIKLACQVVRGPMKTPTPASSRHPGERLGLRDSRGI
jgi:hypothetical protein